MLRQLCMTPGWRAGVSRVSLLPKPCVPIVATAIGGHFKVSLGGLPTAHIVELDTGILKKAGQST
jgi:hypothetical protein